MLFVLFEWKAADVCLGLFAEGIRQKTSWLTESEEAGAKVLSAWATWNMDEELAESWEEAVDRGVNNTRLTTTLFKHVVYILCAGVAVFRSFSCAVPCGGNTGAKASASPTWQANVN